MDTSDLSTWPTKDAAAAAIGISTKTLEQFAKHGKIRQERWRPPTGGQWLSVYSPEDVARVKHERDNPPAALARATVFTPQRAGRSRELPAVVGAAVPAVTASAPIDVDVLAAALQKPRVTEKVFLTMPEAVDLSGLPESLIRRKCKAGELAGAFKYRGWRIPRMQILALAPA